MTELVFQQENLYSGAGRKVISVKPAILSSDTE